MRTTRILAIVAVFSVAGVAQADLIQNGDFEAGGTNWGMVDEPYITNTAIFGSSASTVLQIQTSTAGQTLGVYQHITVDSAGAASFTMQGMGRNTTDPFNAYSISDCGTLFMNLYAGSITDFSSATPITADSSVLPDLSTSAVAFSKTYNSLIEGTYTVFVGGTAADPIGGYGLFQGAIDNVSFTVTTTPEPSTIVLLASALVGLSAYAWRKRKCVPS
jgi:hypothetical protein